MHRPTEPESALRSPVGRYGSCNVHIRRQANSASAFSPNIGARSERDQLSHPRSSADVWCNWLAEGGLRRSAVGVLGLEEKLGGIICLVARKICDNFRKASDMLSRLNLRISSPMASRTPTLPSAAEFALAGSARSSTNALPPPRTTTEIARTESPSSR